MPEWKDKGIILSAKKYGERGLILNILTENQGRHLGWFNNYKGKKNTSDIQPGNIVDVTWKSRLNDQLGNYKLELITSVSGKIFDDRLKLQALSSACSMIDTLLPERENYFKIFRATRAFIDLISLFDENNYHAWMEGYVKWEIGVLSSVGFSLDLTKCAVTGIKNNLSYVSPKTGRAVTSEGAGEYASKLFYLPYFLGGTKNENYNYYSDVLSGLKITSYFFKNKLFTTMSNNKIVKLPDTRNRLIEMIEKL